ncbi:hypothetical protein ZWY2020_030477 [Hordeum vulgare]|nr:hypothetical protein ZWY2020_030477 [Hordeum vulgare]
MAMELRRSSSFFARSATRALPFPWTTIASPPRRHDLDRGSISPVSPHPVDLASLASAPGPNGGGEREDGRSMRRFQKHVFHRPLSACSPRATHRGGRAMASRRALAATGVSETKDGGVGTRGGRAPGHAAVRVVSALGCGCERRAVVRFQEDGCRASRPLLGPHGVRYTRSQSCPFCRGSLKRVQSRDLLTGDDDVIDPVTLEKENVRHFQSFIDSLPLIVPDNLLLVYYDYLHLMEICIFNFNIDV